MWRSMSHARQWREPDWQYASDTVELAVPHLKKARKLALRRTELRDMQMGTTWSARQDMHIRYMAAADEPARAGVTSLEVVPRLKILRGLADGSAPSGNRARSQQTPFGSEISAQHQFVLRKSCDVEGFPAPSPSHRIDLFISGNGLGAMPSRFCRTRKANSARYIRGKAAPRMRTPSPCWVIGAAASSVMSLVGEWRYGWTRLAVSGRRGRTPNSAAAAAVSASWGFPLLQ